MNNFGFEKNGFDYHFWYSHGEKHALKFSCHRSWKKYRKTQYK